MTIDYYEEPYAYPIDALRAAILHANGWMTAVYRYHDDGKAGKIERIYLVPPEFHEWDEKKREALMIFEEYFEHHDVLPT